MKATIVPPPWLTTVPPELLDALVILEGTWREAAIEFAAIHHANTVVGKSPPLGAQRYLNTSLTEAFRDENWIANRARFIKDNLWIRVTFRHQMSIGGDFLEALKILQKGYAKYALILAASPAFLRVISPRDINSLVSSEKLAVELQDLHGVITAPIYIGELTPISALPPATHQTIMGRIS